MNELTITHEGPTLLLIPNNILLQECHIRYETARWAIEAVYHPQLGWAYSESFAEVPRNARPKVIADMIIPKKINGIRLPPPLLVVTVSKTIDPSMIWHPNLLSLLLSLASHPGAIHNKVCHLPFLTVKSRM